MPISRVDVPFQAGEWEKEIIAADIAGNHATGPVASLAENLIDTSVSELYAYTREYGIAGRQTVFLKVRLARGAVRQGVVGVNVYLEN